MARLLITARSYPTTEHRTTGLPHLTHLTHLTLLAAPTALGPSPKIMPQHFRPPPAYLPRVLRPPPLPPIPITTRLRRQQMEQRLAIRLATPVHRLTVQLFVKLRAQFVHRVQHIFITPHPAQIARPRPALKMEPMIALLGFFNRLGHALGCRIGPCALPDGRLMQRLPPLEILLRQTSRLQQFQILRPVDSHHALCSDLRPHPFVVPRKFVHHPPAVLSVPLIPTTPSVPI